MLAYLLRETTPVHMKNLTTQKLLSLAGIAIAAPVLALSIIVSARVAGVAENDLLMFALALCGAIVGGINGFGRRTIKARAHSDRSHKDPQQGVALLS